ncbi:MAG TPA: transposase [Gammaproteobacteria bacterium]|nr:transposase [Gammaproteobacteria bacterium]
MTRPRRELVCVETTPFYHCVSRCVRRAFLCGADAVSGRDFEHRRQWILDRLVLLCEVFAIDVAAYAIMSNHYHLVVRIDRDRALSWDRSEVAERWYRLFGRQARVDRFLAGELLTTAEQDAVDAQIDTWRARLYDLGWFMRCLNEHIARLANAEDGCTGRFWEGRFKSQALLDEAAVLACMAYVDLNPVRAGIADTPEASEYTSVSERIRNADAVSGGRGGSGGGPAPHRHSGGHLLPFFTGEASEALGAVLPFDFWDYLSLVDWTGRAVRENKRGAIPGHLAPILHRLGIEPGNWLESVSRFECHYRRVIGPVEVLRALAVATGIRWFQGISSCLRFYRPSPV